MTVIYQAKSGAIELRGDFERENIWATQADIAALFGIQRPAVTKHLSNIFDSGELVEKSVCSILEHTAGDGKKYKTHYYNLDAIISIGYRVNWFLRKARIKTRRNMNASALTALTLLVAESDPKKKDQMVALVTQMLR